MRKGYLENFVRLLSVSVFLMILLTSDVSASSRPRYYCIQLISSRNFDTAKRVWEKFQTEPDARIEKLGKYFTVRIGYFKSKNLARKEMRKIKNKLHLVPDSFIRSCFYNQKTIVAIANKTIATNTSRNHQKEEKLLKNRSFKNKKSGILQKKVKFLSEKRKVNNNKDLYYMYMQKAKVCMGKRDCSLAVKYLRKAIQENPDDPKTYVYLGYAYLHLSNFDKAFRAFQQALMVDPCYAEGYEALGYFYLKLNNPKAAKIFLEKAYTLKPNNVYYAVNYAIVLMELNDYKKAEKIFSDIKSKFPFIPEIYFNEALLYLKKKDWEKAKEDLETFVSLTRNVKRYRPYLEKAKQILNIISRFKIEEGLNTN